MKRSASLIGQTETNFDSKNCGKKCIMLTSVKYGEGKKKMKDNIIELLIN